jgi:hypothetical protein
MATVTRNFKVRGLIQSMFSPEGEAPVPNYIANMLVELWQKGPLQTIFLGSGFTQADGEFTVEFDIESPSPVIVDGKINDVFLKVYYNGEMIIGEADDDDGGSFD